MDVDQFLLNLLHELSGVNFVKNVNFETEAFILKGRIILDHDNFLQVYYNARTGTTAFALVENEKRTWGIDYDHIRGWHTHPIDNPEDHIETTPKNISEIIQGLKDTWIKLDKN